MGTGILVCGLNGAGKSTLGKVLAEKLDYHFIDDEDLYFPKTDPCNLYATPRTQTEAKALLFREIEVHEQFVFAAVKGDYGEDICSLFQYVVMIHVPKEIRMRRVENRSFGKFGKRMLQGGDLYEKENRFFDFVKSRSEDTLEEWIRSLTCPVIRIDGTKPVTENVNYIIDQLYNSV